MPANPKRKVDEALPEEVARPSSSSVKSLFGILHRPGMHPVSVEEMDEAIGRHLAEDDERIQKGRA